MRRKSAGFNRNSVVGILLLFVMAMVGCQKTLVQDGQLSPDDLQLSPDDLQHSPDDLKVLLPGDTEDFTLVDAEAADDVMFVKGEYRYEPVGETLLFLIGYDEGAQKMSEEYPSTSYSAQKLRYSTVTDKLEEATDSDEAREIARKLRSNADLNAFYKWELENSTLAEDFPLVEAVPLRTGSFALTGFEQINPRRMRVSYTHPEAESSISIEVYYGERARQEYEYRKCEMDQRNEMELGELTFRGYAIEGYLEAGKKFDESFVSMTLRAGDDQEESSEFLKQFAQNFAGSFDFDALTAFQLPGMGEPLGDLSAGDFPAFFPEEIEEFSLQELNIDEENMHVQGHYVYEPLDHDVTIHMAYGPFRSRLGGMNTELLGRFQLAVETDCLRTEFEDRSQFSDLLDRIYEAFDHQELMRREIAHLSVEEIHPLTAYIDREIGSYTLDWFYPEEDDLRVIANYKDPEGKTLELEITHGDRGVHEYRRHQLMFFEEKGERFEADGLTFKTIEMRGDYVTFAYVNNLLLVAGYEDAGEPDRLQQKLTGFFSEWQPGRLAGFEAPEDAEMQFDGYAGDGTPICLDTDCFDDHLSACREAQFGGMLNIRLGVSYRIEGPTDNGDCRLSMVYTRNPNSEWEGQPLYFTLNPEERFQEIGRDVVEACLAGRVDEYNCEGPLLDLTAGSN